MVCLQETKLSKAEGEHFLTYCKGWKGLFVQAMGSDGGIGILWRECEFSVSLVENHQNWLAVKAFSMSLNVHFIGICIYGPTKTKEKQRIWGQITDFLNLQKQGMLILGGDFNSILDVAKKLGGNNCTTQGMVDFRNFIQNSGLMDIYIENGIYTWTNRRRDFLNISERLDRFPISPVWIQDDFSVRAKFLPCSISNHFPIELHIDGHFHNIKTCFKFESMWWKDHNLISQLELWWREAKFGGSISFQIHKKLQYIKLKLKDWNRNVFRNIFYRKYFKCTRAQGA
ncbi:uncharacterized protein LOC131070400 [Cryptomeria japonica]|uniref:uncharacterized protein LOC131070400 n=1 Tax=Cryptomeria japonica TaxID=3369 RepID=UPI0025ABDBFF|nr:uncharacterized protein LOC131070400 [Cryptomeria japonica]